MHIKKSGLVFGSFLAFWHFVWGLLVLTGLAQPLLNLIFNLHMIANPFQVLPFNLGLWLGLIVVTFIVGYVFGCFFAWLFNKVHKQQHQQ